MKPFYIRRYARDKLHSYCECGEELPFQKTNENTSAARLCPNCGRVNNEDIAPINWAKVYQGGNR